MATIDSIVDLIHPSSAEVGVVLADQIFVIFDKEIDESTLNEGHFFVEGPDTMVLSGPDLLLHQTSPLNILENDSDILATPGFQSTVAGAYTFDRISNTSLVTVSGTDRAGDGTLYRTKVIFTPTQLLAPEIDYNVYLAGDEDLTDGLDTGILSRTVFDTITNIANTSDGVAVFTGGYIGEEASDVYNVDVTTSGDIGTARYRWWKDSAPGDVEENIRTSLSDVLLGTGVYVRFEDQPLDFGDKFTVVTKAGVVYSGNFSWSFSTGSGSITAVPTSTATSIIGEPVTYTASSGIFAVSSTSPSPRSVSVSSGINEIVLTFTNPIDAATVSSSGVTVLAEPADGDELLMTPRELATDLLVDGSNLRIRIL